MKADEAEIRERIFFALWPDEAEQEALAGWQALLRSHCKGRYMQATSLHVTLVFLGGVTPEQMRGVLTAGHALSGRAFDLCWDRLGYWPHNHIVHAAASAPLILLHDLVGQLRRELDMRGVVLPIYPFLPHVTLVRNARCLAAEMLIFEPVVWRIRDIWLMRSLKGKGPAMYEAIERFELKY